ncbi:hypothetical protein FRC01_003683, partial [Tulasnella sp. 417]
MNPFDAAPISRKLCPFALDLNMKRFTNKAQIQQATFDLRAITVLRKGKPEDEEIVNKAREPKGTGSYSNAFYSVLSSPIKGKGKNKA